MKYESAQKSFPVAAHSFTHLNLIKICYFVGNSGKWNQICKIDQN